MPKRGICIHQGVQMNWNPFKRASSSLNSDKVLVLNLFTRLEALEKRIKELEAQTVIAMEEKKVAYRREYAREYYARRKANLPTAKQIEMQARRDILKGQA
jgi:phosphotransacetylase